MANKLGPFTDAYVEIDDNDISEWCDSVMIHQESDKVEVTGFGASSKEYRKGLGDLTASFEAFSDYTDNGLNEILDELFTRTTPFEFKVRPVNTSISANNPQYVMAVLMFTNDPVDGGVGDAAKTKVELQGADQDGLVKEIGTS